MQVSELNVNNLVRSAVVLVLGAPLMLSLSNSLGTETRLTDPGKSAEVARRIKGDLTRPCLDFAISKNDSKLERDAKNEIDEYFGGEVNYQALCAWVTS